MSDAFVPLAGKETRRDSPEPFRVKVVSAAGAVAAAFKPAANPTLDPVPPPPPPPTVCSTPHPRSEPEVSLVRDGERITRIQVKCACGEVIDLQCVY